MNFVFLIILAVVVVVLAVALPVILKLIGAGKLHSLAPARLALRATFGVASRRSQRLGSLYIVFLPNEAK